MTFQKSNIGQGLEGWIALSSVEGTGIQAAGTVVCRVCGEAGVCCVHMGGIGGRILGTFQLPVWRQWLVWVQSAGPPGGVWE